MKSVTIRRFREGDAFAVSEMICTTLAVSNSRDYPRAFIGESIRQHTPEHVMQIARDAHFYVACCGDTVIGCGGITGY